MLSLEFHPEAKADYETATDWYDRVAPELGNRFVAEFERSIRRILKNPRHFRQLSTRTQRCLLRVFPYAIIFATRDNRAIVVAVMHLHRDPDYRKHRLEGITQ